MGEDYMSTTDIMQKLGLTDRKHFNQTYILPAIKEGAIERKYPDTPNHPHQQYQLTEQAKEWKENRG